MLPDDCAQAPSAQAAPAKPRPWLWMIFATVWFASTATGLWVLWSWDNKPGVAAQARAHWPAGSRLAHDRARPTLVMLVHPQCTCSRASLTELAECLPAPTPSEDLCPLPETRGIADGWEKTDPWRAAAALPDVTVIRDDEGATADRFGAVTSGQTFLYDARGTLQFSGGITSARGHAGNNAGRARWWRC